MPKVSTKKPVKPKAPKTKDLPKDSQPREASTKGNGAPAEAAAAPAAPMELELPTRPVENLEEEEKAAQATPSNKRDMIAASMNIAKLQAMSMTELNQMAKELGVENF